MSDRLFFILRAPTHSSRFLAQEAIQKAPEGWTVTLAPPKRTDAQNRKLHAMLGEVAKQQKCWGQVLSQEEWKRWFSAALWQQKLVPGMEGGMVMLGEQTRNMSIKKINEMIELIYYWGSQPETFVDFKDVEEEPEGPISYGSSSCSLD